MNARMLDRYKNDSIETASPARLLTMLYDRLVLDLQRAEAALTGGNLEVASSNLTHAQDIVIELRATLDVTKWSGAPALAELYSFLLRELIQANVTKAADRAASCRILVEPLRDAWHIAADRVAA